MIDSRVSRRHLVTALAATAIGALAGCTGSEPSDGTGDDGDDDRSPTDTGGDETGNETPTETRTPDTETETPDDEPSPDTPSPRLFTGEERVFVVNGYSTSRVWPDVLQRKLDRYFDGNRVISVEKALEPGTPIARWMDRETGEPREPWRETLAPALDRATPVIALAQQSLQWAYHEREAGIDGRDDTGAIEHGADVLELYANRLLEDGAAHVFIATHIYKKPMEPVIGNERLALEALLDRDPANVTAGPDVWEPTKDHWPEAFHEDEVHPNDAGAEIMAHYWFQRLLESDERTVPDWSREEMETALTERSADDISRSLFS